MGILNLFKKGSAKTEVVEEVKHPTFEMSSNGTQEYCCTVVRIGEVLPIEGADKIGKTIVNGESIVVRKDQVKEGDVMLYASNETQLHEGFLGANNLFEVGCFEKNANASESIEDAAAVESGKIMVENTRKLIKKLTKNIKSYKSEDAKMTEWLKSIVSRNIETPDGEYNVIDKANEALEKLKASVESILTDIDARKAAIRSRCGFFNKHGRVKLIRLKGVPSGGYLFTLDELAKWKPEVSVANLEEMIGMDFDTVCGELFVKAYVPPIKERPSNGHGGRSEKLARKAEKKFNRLVPGQFKFHYDTNPLAKNMHLINPDTIVTISDKIHGCVEKSTIVNTMEYGDMTIGEIVNKKINCHIKARDIENDCDVYVPIDNYYRVNNDGEWYEIELEDGKKITITGNNPVWCPELGLYRRVDELNGEEKLLISD